METELKKKDHVLHPEYGLCEVRYRKHHDKSQVFVAMIDETLGYRERKTGVVDETELEVVEVGSYNGTDPITTDDYVTLTGECLWRVLGIREDKDTVLKFRVEHVKSGEEKVVATDEVSEPSDEVVAKHGYRRNCDGDIILDWWEIGHERLLFIPTSSYSRYWKEGGRGDSVPYTAKEVSKAVKDFWNYVESKAPCGSRFVTDFDELLEESVYENGDFHVEDASFGYEYGSISGVHESYDAWVEFAGAEIDVYAYCFELFDEDSIEICVEDEDFEFYVDLDLSGLEVEEVELGGVPFFHITGEIEQG